ACDLGSGHVNAGGTKVLYKIQQISPRLHCNIALPRRVLKAVSSPARTQPRGAVVRTDITSDAPPANETHTLSHDLASPARVPPSRALRGRTRALAVAYWAPTCRKGRSAR